MALQQYRLLYTRNRIVQVARIGLPVASVALLALTFLFAPHTMEDTLSFSVARERILADGLRIDSPSFQGLTPSGEVFHVEADWALPTGTSMEDVSEVALHDIQGQLELQNGETLALSAQEALAEIHNKFVTLSGVVHVTTTDGYTLQTQQATVDGMNNVLRSDAPVTLTGTPGATLNAGHMVVTRDAETQDFIARFSRGVTVVFDPVGVAP